MNYLRLLNILLLSLTTVLVLLLPSQAKSVEITTNGFFSVHAGKNLKDEVERYGYDNNIRYRPDTLAGLQFTAKANDKISATVQLIGRADEKFDVSADWAYLSYRINENWTLQGGRLRIPWNAMSNYVEVRQSYHWTRPPDSVYDSAFYSFEGFKLRHKKYIGDWEFITDLTFADFLDPNYTFAGRSDNPIRLVGKNWTVLSFDITDDEHRFFAAFHSHKGEGSENLREIQQGLDILKPAYPDVYAAINDKSTTYSYNFGYFFDNEQYMIQSEWRKQDLKGYFSDGYSFYLSAGYYLDDWLIHLTFEDDKNKPHLELADGIPDGDPLKNLALALIRVQEKKQRNWSFGVKYDLDSHTSFKTMITLNETDDIKSEVVSVGFDFAF